MKIKNETIVIIWLTNLILSGKRKMIVEVYTGFVKLFLEGVSISFWNISTGTEKFLILHF
ncbi:hypothetical protein GCM10022393_12570 [Aquimarina addita]|uniref:Uncharacterized protein n=1 Tax=Aquimarina addita TaxID=870485 RepID=A0ABP7XFI2_9FLAO